MSSELHALTPKGAIKVRSYARLPEGQRWNLDYFKSVCGVPWEPIPGHGMREVKSKVYIPIPRSMPDIPEPMPRENQKRRMYMSKKDVQRHGWHTIGCPGCEAANRGEPAKNHTEACRTAYEQMLQQRDPQK